MLRKAQKSSGVSYRKIVFLFVTKVVMPSTAILLATFSFTATAYSGVNLKNGNFYISYTDLELKGVVNIEVGRTYNSKSTYRGQFGYGWGSDFETYLQVAPDGTVVIYENGSGAVTSFSPEQESQKYQRTLDASLKALVKVFMSRQGPDGNKSEGELLKWFREDSERRRSYWSRYVRAGHIKEVPQIQEGTRFFSSQRGLQYVTRTEDGYIREYSDGKRETFNISGSLTSLTDKQGNAVTITHYGDENKIRQIRNTQGQRLFFFYGDQNTVERIVSTEGSLSLYHYDEERNLSYSQDSSGNKFDYRYDRNHNMIEILYADGTRRRMTYEPERQFVSKVTERDEKTTAYTYGGNDFKYWTEVEKSAPYNPDEKIKNKYEYEIGRLENGRQYTKVIATTINGVRSETIYRPDGLPKTIKRGSRRTDFEYNDKGLLTRRDNGKEITELEYHNVFDKITRVTNFRADNEGEKSWTKFKYDEAGNLSHAETSDGRTVTLVYDGKGRIDRMTSGGKENKNQILTYKYEETFGKPVEISIQDKGKINIEYDDEGEITSVHSDEGHKMALLVTQAFQELLGIVKPAGVDLNL